MNVISHFPENYTGIAVNRIVRWGVVEDAVQSNGYVWLNRLSGRDLMIAIIEKMIEETDEAINAWQDYEFEPEGTPAKKHLRQKFLEELADILEYATFARKELRQRHKNDHRSRASNLRACKHEWQAFLESCRANDCPAEAELRRRMIILVWNTLACVRKTIRDKPDIAQFRTIQRIQGRKRRAKGAPRAFLLAKIALPTSSPWVEKFLAKGQRVALSGADAVNASNADVKFRMQMEGRG